MIDFIKLQTQLAPEGAEALRQRMAAAGCPFEVVVNRETGQIVPNTKERAQWRGYGISLLPVERNGYCRHCWVTLEGSLHKSYHGGKNFEPFPFPQLLEEIARIENGLQLPADCWKIDNLEIGVNIRPPFEEPAARFIDTHLLMQGAKEVRFYKKSEGKQLGKHTEGDKHFLKVYDKGLQYDLPFPLMRVEVHYSKMATLNAKGIYHLSDLRHISQLEALLGPLRAAWDKVLLTEPLSATAAALLAKCSPKEKALWKWGQHIRNWKELQKANRKNFEYTRGKWHLLRLSLGCNTREEISRRIAAEWHRLAHYPVPDNYPDTLLANGAPENALFTFFPTWIKGEKGKNLEHPAGGSPAPLPATKGEGGTPAAGGLAPVQNFTKLNIEKGTAGETPPVQNLTKPNIQKGAAAGEVASQPPRRCLTCGRDISEQKDGAIFCGDKVAGERGAHQCRNTRSNLRQRLAALEAQKGGFLFDCTPFIAVPVFPHHFAGKG